MLPQWPRGSSLCVVLGFVLPPAVRRSLQSGGVFVRDSGREAVDEPQHGHSECAVSAKTPPSPMLRSLVCKMQSEIRFIYFKGQRRW